MKKKAKPNQIVIEDTIHDITPAYKAGAMAMRQGVSHKANPHEISTQQHWDWDAGHVNESCGEHHRFGLDLIELAPKGQLFDEDPAVTRDQWGEVVRSA